jgi:hypothetical protein
MRPISGIRGFRVLRLASRSLTSSFASSPMAVRSSLSIQSFLMNRTGPDLPYGRSFVM